jgi:hypothetical protein
MIDLGDAAQWYAATVAAFLQLGPPARRLRNGHYLSEVVAFRGCRATKCDAIAQMHMEGALRVTTPRHRYKEVRKYLLIVDDRDKYDPGKMWGKTAYEYAEFLLSLQPNNK